MILGALFFHMFGDTGIASRDVIFLVSILISITAGGLTWWYIRKRRAKQ